MAELAARRRIYLEKEGSGGEGREVREGGRKRKRGGGIYRDMKGEERKYRKKVAIRKMSPVFFKKCTNGVLPSFEGIHTDMSKADLFN